VMVHGGGFTDGDKAWSEVPQFAMQFATRGFLAVSVNYRLTGEYWSWTSQQAVLDAVEDVRAAIRYVRSVATEYNVDTDRILLSGESAGAVTSLYIGYANIAQYEGSSGNPGFSSAVRATLPISGELEMQAYCDSCDPKPTACKIDFPGTDNTDDVKGPSASFAQPPLLMLHGTADCTVPYVNGKKVYDRAQTKGLSSGLITMEGAAHVPWDVIFTSAIVEKTMVAVSQNLDLPNAQAPSGCASVSVDAVRASSVMKWPASGLVEEAQ